MKTLTILAVVLLAQMVVTASAYEPSLEKCKFKVGATDGKEATYGSVDSTFGQQLAEFGLSVGVYCKLKVTDKTTCYLEVNEMDEEFMSPTDIVTSAFKSNGSQPFLQYHGKDGKSFVPVKDTSAKGRHFTMTEVSDTGRCYTNYIDDGNAPVESVSNKPNVELHIKANPYSNNTGFTLHATEDSVTIHDVVFNRGNCKLIHTTTSRLKKSPVIKFGGTFKGNAYNCKVENIKEVAITTNNGTFTYGF